MTSLAFDIIKVIHDLLLGACKQTMSVIKNKNKHIHVYILYIKRHTLTYIHRSSNTENIYNCRTSYQLLLLKMFRYRDLKDWMLWEILILQGISFHIDKL